MSKWVCEVCLEEEGVDAPCELYINESCVSDPTLCPFEHDNRPKWENQNYE